jgi:KDO transferase-3
LFREAIVGARVKARFDVGAQKHRNVFMVGVDLNEKSGRFYENRESAHSPCGLDQHYYTRILPSLELMSHKVMGDDFRVYNLSDCSRIPESVVPRVTLAQVEAMRL